MYDNWEELENSIKIAINVNCVQLEKVLFLEKAINKRT